MDFLNKAEHPLKTSPPWPADWDYQKNSFGRGSYGKRTAVCITCCHHFEDPAWPSWSSHCRMMIRQWLDQADGIGIAGSTVSWNLGLWSCVTIKPPRFWKKLLLEIKHRFITDLEFYRSRCNGIRRVSTSPSKIFKVSESAGKVMATIFWDSNHRKKVVSQSLEDTSTQQY